MCNQLRGSGCQVAWRRHGQALCILAAVGDIKLALRGSKGDQPPLRDRSLLGWSDPYWGGGVPVGVERSILGWRDPCWGGAIHIGVERGCGLTHAVDNKGEDNQHERCGDHRGIFVYARKML